VLFDSPPHPSSFPPSLLLCPSPCQANGEQNRDGESHNNSWNCGEEGPTAKWEVHVSEGGE
jgi:hypothetical protein